MTSRTRAAREDRLATEEPLEIRLAWPGRPARRVWVTMRTPGPRLRAGRRAGWCTRAWPPPDASGRWPTAPTSTCARAGVQRRHRHPDRPPAPIRATATPRRPGPRPAGCAARTASPRPSPWCGRPRWTGPAAHRRRSCRGLPGLLRAAQPLFDRTGGVHAAALATAAGDLLVVREDVGRHNAVDKVTGARVLAGRAHREACLVVSGRAGFELVQKAVAAGIGALVAVGAPTTSPSGWPRRPACALRLHQCTTCGAVHLSRSGLCPAPT